MPGKSEARDADIVNKVFDLDRHHRLDDTHCRARDDDWGDDQDQGFRPGGMGLKVE